MIVISMLPNNTGSSKLVNVTITYIDKNADDIDDASDDDEDTNNNDLLSERQCFMASTVTSIELLSGEKVVNRSVINDKMTIPQVNETLIARRPSSISLKPLVTVNFDIDQTDGCFGKKEEIEHDCDKGINVKFQDLIYRARRGFSWDRCKWSTYFNNYNFNRNNNLMMS